MLLSVSLLIIEHRGDKLNGLRAVISVFAYPIQYLTGLPSELSFNLFGTGLSYSDLLKENQKLKQQQLINQSKLLKLSALEKENIRLHALFENSYKLGEQFLVVELLSVNLAAYEQTVLINKGSRFEIYPKQPVLDAKGVVGQVIRTHPLTSEIMLITDPSHAIPVQVNRNGLRTIAVGSGQPNRLNLPFLPNNADIQVGDLLVTSGLGEIFPPDYPVGVINEFKAQPGKPFAMISASPSASLDRSREFLIVWSNRDPIPLTAPSYKKIHTEKTAPEQLLPEQKKSTQEQHE